VGALSVGPVWNVWHTYRHVGARLVSLVTHPRSAAVHSQRGRGPRREEDQAHGSAWEPHLHRHSYQRNFEHWHPLIDEPEKPSHHDKAWTVDVESNPSRLPRFDRWMLLKPLTNNPEKRCHSVHILARKEYSSLQHNRDFCKIYTFITITR
jgi:hypothetical protein